MDTGGRSVTTGRRPGGRPAARAPDRSIPARPLLALSILVALSILALPLCAPSLGAAPPDPSIVCRPDETPPCVRADGFWRDAPAAKQAAYLVERMNDAELLGQILALGYLGTGFPDALRAWIAERHLGSVKVSGRNVAGLAELAAGVGAMQEAARATRLQVPLLVLTDQEGGWVRHVKSGTSQTPGNLALGAAGIPDDAFQTGRFIGQELRALGINMNLAPTVDVYSHPAAAVIGPRAFSSDPAQTALLSVAFYHGLNAAGVIATAKHFPGHGGAVGDSHATLAVADADLRTLWERDLLPYRLLIREGLPAIMSAHVGYPRLIDPGTPASLSPFFLRELLRGRLGFDGMVISDDLEMQGALGAAFDTAAAAVRAIEAGTDLLLIGHTPARQERAWQALRQRMVDPAFREQVAQAARRVLRVKLEAFGSPAAVPLFPAADAASAVPAPGAAEFFRESAARSVTAVRSAGIPFRPDPSARLLIVGQSDAFLQEALLRFPQADRYRFPFSPFYASRPQDRDAVRTMAGDYDAIVFLLMNYNSAEVLAGLAPYADRVLVVSALTPVYLIDLPWVRTAVAVYGPNRDSYRAGLAVLAGDFAAEGRLPIDFGRATGAP